jgi:hypothetical protein
MIKARFASCAVLMLSFIYPLFASAQEEKPKTPNEPAPINLPAAAQSYKHFYSSPQLDFAIDLDSISVQPTEENEIRYALKATSKQGANNVSYEGIRCDTHQKIIYAIGRDDGSWARTRSPEWSAIPKNGTNLQHFNLAHDFFCTGNTLSGSVESMRNRIQWNRPLNAYGR